MRAALYLVCLVLVGLALGALILDARRVPLWLSLVGGLAALAAGRLDPGGLAADEGHACRDAPTAPRDSLAPVTLPVAPANRRRSR